MDRWNQHIWNTDGWLFSPELTNEENTLPLLLLGFYAVYVLTSYSELLMDKHKWGLFIDEHPVLIIFNRIKNGGRENFGKELWYFLYAD